MSTTPGLRIFGFPVDVRPGFVVLLGLFVVLYSGQGRGDLGIWIAGSVGVFTLCHELGHAFAARATGAEASIALDFLAGYASFEPTRRLKRWERAGISLAGPAVQILLGLGVLALMRVNPLDYDQVRQNASSIAIWWAGPILGAINLAPILPLDGGNIVMSGIDVFIPGRSRAVMIYFSIVATGGAIIFFGRHDPSQAIFFIFPLVVQIQMLQHRKTQQSLDEHGSWQQWANSAERDAWTIGKPGAYPPGMVPSPWFRAAEFAREGKRDEARNLLLADFANTQQPNWIPPDPASDLELTALVGLLPQPLPTGNPYSEYVLASILTRLRQFETAGRYAAESYARNPGTMPAVIVAQCAASLGDDELAVGWLRAAYSSGTNLPGLAEALDRRAEFAHLRSRPDVASLRHALASAA
ncbi:MAG: peptidase family protein [Ilumatobacteraceae bacterium]|nr:peptidase family protein [Ilumatobacteraceae bacterium]